jgi:hypothetical protein
MKGKSLLFITSLHELCLEMKAAHAIVKGFKGLPKTTATDATTTTTTDTTTTTIAMTRQQQRQRMMRIDGGRSAAAC